jgi:hypothetical protein
MVGGGEVTGGILRSVNEILQDFKRGGKRLLYDIKGNAAGAELSLAPSN